MTLDDNFYFLRPEFDHEDRQSVISWASWLKGKSLWDSYSLLSKENQRIIASDLEHLRSEIARKVSERTYKGDKGIVGQLVEMVHFGLKRNNRKGPDLKAACLELKSTGLIWREREKDWAAKERLTLGQINYEELICSPDNLGAVHELKGLANVLMVIYFYTKSAPFIYGPQEKVTIASMMSSKFAGAFEWNAGPDIQEMASYDWRLIKAMCESGYAHMISERYSKFMGCAPRGLGTKTPGKEACDFSAQTVEEAQGEYAFGKKCRRLQISEGDAKRVFSDIRERSKYPRNRKKGYALPPDGHHNVKVHGQFPKQRRAFTLPPESLTAVIKENLKL